MAQEDYNIANAPGAPFRVDINNTFEAVVTLNSGPSEPPALFPYMHWADTTTGLLKQRNASNTAWVIKGTLAAEYGGIPSSSVTFDNATSGLSATDVEGALDEIAAQIYDPFSSLLFHVQDEKSSGTAGGTFTQGAQRRRDLTTVKTNEISGASLSSHQVTLPAGRYYAEFSCPAVSCENNQARLQDVTNAATLILGSCEVADSGARVAVRSLGSGRFTLADDAALELQHYCTSTKTTNGFGQPADITTEIYSILRIWKLQP